MEVFCPHAKQTVSISAGKKYESVSQSASLRRILDSIVVSIPACHAGDRGSIPRRGGLLF